MRTTTGCVVAKFSFIGLSARSYNLDESVWFDIVPVMIKSIMQLLEVNGKTENEERPFGAPSCDDFMEGQLELLRDSLIPKVFAIYIDGKVTLKEIIEKRLVLYHNGARLYFYYHTRDNGRWTYVLEEKVEGNLNGSYVIQGAGHEDASSLATVIAHREGMFVNEQITEPDCANAMAYST